MSKALRLKAISPDDLTAFSACLQDAAIKVSDIAYIPKDFRFAFVGNRYCWEHSKNERKGQRVRSACRFENVIKTSSQNIPLNIKDHVLSLLSIHTEMGDDGMASIFLLFSGDASIKLEVECIESFLEDISKPWQARSRPSHEQNDEKTAEPIDDESFEE